MKLVVDSDDNAPNVAPRRGRLSCDQRLYSTTQPQTILGRHAMPVDWDNKNDVLAAVRNLGDLLFHASDELCADKEVVLATVEQEGNMLEFASDTLRADREVVLAAVKQDGNALEWASDALRANREVLLAAVEQNYWALTYAADELCADKEVVLAAVKQNGNALHFASQELRRNPILQSWQGLTRKQRLLRQWREHVVLLRVTYFWQLVVAKRQEKERIANAELGVIENWEDKPLPKRPRLDDK